MQHPGLPAETLFSGTNGALEAGILTLGVLVFVVLLLWRVIIPSWVRRRRALITDGASWIEDRAWNQIQAGIALADFLERQGVKVAAPRAQLELALGKYEMKRYGEAQRVAREATAGLSTLRKSASSSGRSGGTEPPGGREGAGRKGASRPPSPDPEEEEKAPVYRDLARRVGDPDPETPLPSATATSIPPGAVEDARSGATSSGASKGKARMQEEGGPTPMAADEEEENALVAERKKLPKNYMEARFMLNSLQADLQLASSGTLAGPPGKEAQDWAKQSQAAFDRKDYDKALLLALRGRRRLGGAGLSTISLSPGTVVEAPPEGPSAAALRSSAPPLVTGPAGAAAASRIVCPRCGRANTGTDRFCRACGSPLVPPECPRCQRPVEAEDKFCHGCGAPLGGSP